MTIRFALPGRALVGAAVVAALFPPAIAAQRQNGLLVGRVLSGDVAVPGAAIFVSGGRVTIARVDGRFRMSLPPGHYEVRAQRIGYTASRDSIVISGGQTATANFRIERSLSMLDAVATIGTRGYERSVIEVPAPVDVLYGTTLRGAGSRETSRMLQALAPSINAPRASIAAGSDLVHPVTMRGLGPDQVLVLVNGRRRHTSAMLNVNGTTGHGSTGVDLDAIPSSMIERIEVLRDGAAAQYGGDAVAGVINVVLKSGVHGDATSTVGGNATTFNRSGDGSPAYPVSERSLHDGRSVQGSIDKGIVFGERGFLHGDFEMRSREFTNRALPDPRLQYQATDPRAAETGVSQDLVSNRAGDPASHDVALFLNGGNQFANGVELYGNAGGSRRTVEAAGLFRRAIDQETNPALYPSGFLPVIRPTLNDYAGTLGLRGARDDWRWDLGTTYGWNSVGYEVRDSQDSFGTRAGTFDAGQLRYGQSVTNLDVHRSLSWFEEVRIAAGAELRAEQYRIMRGADAQTTIGFAGFGPSQAVDASRHDVAGYADLEAELTSMVLVGVAGRAERYSDLGTLGSGKLSFRVGPMSGVAIRGSAGVSHRAPSMAQLYYGEDPLDPGISGYTTARVQRVAGRDALQNVLPQLRPERATNLSLGIAAEGRALAVSADVYQIVVDDRITVLQNLGDIDPFQPYYSANAAHTRTEGVDVSASYALRLPAGSLLRLAGGANASRTNAYTVGSYGSLGLGRMGLTRLEHGQPNVNLLGSATITRGELGGVLRARHYGDVRVAGRQGDTSLDQTYGGRTLVDANLSYTLLRKYTLTAGADNLLDAYPDRNRVPGTVGTAADNGYHGIFPYSASSPFGFSGRYVFGRLSIYL